MCLQVCKMCDLIESSMFGLVIRSNLVKLFFKFLHIAVYSIAVNAKTSSIHLLTVEFKYATLQ